MQTPEEDKRPYPGDESTSHLYLLTYEHIGQFWLRYLYGELLPQDLLTAMWYVTCDAVVQAWLGHFKHPLSCKSADN
jgi:hypothetical protein